jgi:phosphoserine / homoserine phosphotransferase
MGSLIIVQRLIALDMEGVITPEIWEAVATHTGISELLRTTRDEPNYQKLMEYRLALLDKHEIKLSLIKNVISDLELLPGARSFLDELRQRYQVVILSDTFEEFASHFSKLLGYPHLLCHKLRVEDDHITGFTLRLNDPKARAVEAYQSLNYHVSAAGDSHNDVTMLKAADSGCLFRAADGLVDHHHDLSSMATYEDLLTWITDLDAKSF